MEWVWYSWTRKNQMVRSESSKFFKSWLANVYVIDIDVNGK